MIYLINIESVGDGTQRVICKAFPEFAAFGPGRKRARWNALPALEKVIAARMAQGRGLPEPATERQIERHTGGKLKLSHLTSEKCTLYRALRQSGMNRTELARRLDWPLEAVESLFRLDRPTRMDHIETALNMLQHDGGQSARRLRAEAAWAKLRTDK